MNIFKQLYHKSQNTIISLQFLQLLRFTTLFLISIAFAKSKYSLNEIGIYEKIIYFAGALSFFWTNGLIQSFLTLYNKYNSAKEKNIFIFNSVVISFLFSLLIIFLLILFEQPLSIFFINTQTIPYKLLFILYLIFSPVSYFVEYIYLLKYETKKIYLYGIITNLFLFVLVILPAFTILSFEYSIVGLVTATFLRFLWLIVLLIKNKTFIFSLEKQILLLKNSLPLILSSFIAGSIPYIDGIIVSNYYDNNTFAIFRYGSRELPISVLLANTFSNAMLPVISKSPETLIVLNDLKNKSLQLIHILFPISIVLIVVSKYLFEFMFNPMFVQSSSIFNVMLLLVIPRLVFPQAILIAKKYQKYTLLASIIEWMSKLILSFILMKIFNIFGIALATFFAFTIEKVVLAFFVFIKLKIKPNIYIPIKWLTFYSALIIITFMFVEYPNLF